MEHLNHYRKLKYLSAFLAGKLIFAITLQAEVLQFFDPMNTPKYNILKTNLKIFLANDPMPIKDFLDDWKGDYSPKNEQNIALLNSRFDFGAGVGENYYLGYFYQYDAFIDTDKDFTDFYYAVKNKNSLENAKRYQLNLEILGIKQNGLIFSGNTKLFDNDAYTLGFGAGVYLSYGLDMQDGYVYGKATINGEKDYSANATSSYYYTHNYLYNLDIKTPYGYGFGSHIGFYYKDKLYQYKIKFLANNLFSKMYWKDLAFSKIILKTQNKSYDKSGYVKYTPTISGLEKYRDYTQTLEPKYRLEASVLLEDTTLFAGTDLSYGEYFPYVKIAHKLNQVETLEMIHESRFGSFGFGYGYKNFKIFISANEFTDVSSFGFGGSFLLRF